MKKKKKKRKGEGERGKKKPILHGWPKLYKSHIEKGSDFQDPRAILSVKRLVQVLI